MTALLPDLGDIPAGVDLAELQEVMTNVPGAVDLGELQRTLAS